MKTMQKIASIAVAGAFGLLASPAANALSIVSYGTVPSFLAAVAASSLYTGPVEHENFNDGVLNPGLSISGPTVTLFTPAQPFFTPSDGLVMEAIVDAPSNTVTISFGGRSMFAMGAHWNLRGPGGPGSNITLNLVGGGTTTFADFVPNSYGSSFKGFVSDTAFSSIVLSEGTGCCQETFQLDNLKYAQAVPEPETYAMLLSGLGLMGFVARRRKKSARI